MSLDKEEYWLIDMVYVDVPFWFKHASSHLFLYVFPSSPQTGLLYSGPRIHKQSLQLSPLQGPSWSTETLLSASKFLCHWGTLPSFLTHFDISQYPHFPLPDMYEPLVSSVGHHSWSEFTRLQPWYNSGASLRYQGKMQGLPASSPLVVMHLLLGPRFLCHPGLVFTSFFGKIHILCL